MIIKSDEFKYPTREERLEAQKKYPKLNCFGFNYKSELELILVDNQSLDSASRSGNLYYWDNYLINRFGKLRETYIYTVTNFNRGFSDDYSECTQSQIVNHLMFDYFAEILYYYFFSTRDIIAQILTLYYNLNIEEDNLYFNAKFIKKIDDLRIQEILKKFLEESSDDSKFRNRFAHRFPPNIPDYRSKITIDDGKESLGFGGGRSTPSVNIIGKIDNLLNSLENLMQSLKGEMIIE